MNYKQYKSNSNKMEVRKPETVNELDTLGQYLKYREACQKFDEEMDITDELTDQDFKLFEENLEKIIEYYHYTDPECDINESCFEDIARHMEREGIRWSSKLDDQGMPCSPDVPDLEACVRSLFESCMEQGKAQGWSSTGGFFVHTDIFHHTVEVMYANEKIMCDDTGSEPY